MNSSLTPIVSKAASLLLISATFISARPASAQEFRITATGTLTEVQNGAGYYDSSVAVGTPFTETFLFDYSFVNHNGLSPNPAEYSPPASTVTYGANITYGNYQFVASPLFDTSQIVYVYNYNLNNIPETTMSLIGSTDIVKGVTKPFSSSESQLLFEDMSGQNVLATEALPPLSFFNNYPPNQIVFNSSITVPVNISGFSGVFGTVNSISAELVNPVPEASTIVSLGLLLALGLGSMVIVKKHKKIRTS